MNEITELNLQEIAAALRAGDFSCRELINSFYENIDQYDSIINAYLSIAPELALAQADRADERYAVWRKDPSQTIPPLLGVPFAVKDVLCVEGLACTSGSRILENFSPAYNATAVQRLLDAGMIVIGKTNTDEFAMGSSTENSAFGPTHNPWKTDRVPGGSSGGSAAAVAARMAPVALGTDTGGSVRQPASFCGVTGLKPTYGSVSRYGLVAYGSSLDVVGAIGKTVNDVATIFKQIAGYDPLDATSRDPESNQSHPSSDAGGSPGKELSHFRVGIPREYFIDGIQNEVRDSINRAVGVFEQFGARIKKVYLPHTEFAIPVYYLIAPAEASANLARYDGIRYGPRMSSTTLSQVYRRTRGSLFGDEVKRRIMLGTYSLSAGYYDAYYGQAQKVRTLIQEDFKKAFEEVDIIAAPVSPTTAFPIGKHTDEPLSMYLEDVFTLPANLAGIPAISFPVGSDKLGLPVGMQFMAPHFKEQVLFSVCSLYQQITDYHREKPGILTQRDFGKENPT